MSDREDNSLSDQQLEELLLRAGREFRSNAGFEELRAQAAWCYKEAQRRIQCEVDEIDVEAFADYDEPKVLIGKVDGTDSAAADFEDDQSELEGPPFADVFQDEALRIDKPPDLSGHPNSPIEAEPVPVAKVSPSPLQTDGGDVPGSETDEPLIRWPNVDHRAALIDIWATLNRYVRAAVYRWTRDHSLVDDVVQEVWLKLTALPLMLRPITGDRIRDLKFIVYRIVRKLCDEHMRRRQFERTSGLLLGESVVDGVSSSPLANEQVQDIRDSIGQLPQLMQAIVTLRVSGVTFREIAMQLSISKRNLRRTYWEALKLLLKRLE